MPGRREDGIRFYIVGVEVALVEGAVKQEGKAHFRMGQHHSPQDFIAESANSFEVSLEQQAGVDRDMFYRFSHLRAI